MLAACTRQFTAPVNIRSVLSGPAPLSVTLLAPEKSIPLERLYVPAARDTTCPLGHAAMADVICAAVAPADNEVHTVVRVGMPPEIPAFVQSTTRPGSMIPDQGWVCEDPTDVNTTNKDAIESAHRIVAIITNDSDSVASALWLA